MKGEDGVEGGGDDRRSGGDGAGLTICIGIACWQKVGSEVEVESRRGMRLAVEVGHVLEQGKGREGASWSWSECECVRIYCLVLCLLPIAYCLLPVLCCCQPCMCMCVCAQNRFT